VSLSSWSISIAICHVGHDSNDHYKKQYNNMMRIDGHEKEDFDGPAYFKLMSTFYKTE
jgi:hypothetical protein